MKVRRIMTMRLCLSFGAALAVTSVLLSHRGESAPNLEGAGIVYVYFPSLCAAPGDSSDCHEIPRPGRPAFDSMATCSAYADVQLRQENNPRLMASCMKQREI
jgi:hypothetical protein